MQIKNWIYAFKPLNMQNNMHKKKLYFTGIKKLDIKDKSLHYTINVFLKYFLHWMINRQYRFLEF
jgi:hypothetical protein